VLADATEPLPKAGALGALTATESKQFERRVTTTELFIDVML
jgi:hypothetical protein